MKPKHMQLLSDTSGTQMWPPHILHLLSFHHHPFIIFILMNYIESLELRNEFHFDVFSPSTIFHKDLCTSARIMFVDAISDIT